MRKSHHPATRAVKALQRTGKSASALAALVAAVLCLETGARAQSIQTAPDAVGSKPDTAIGREEPDLTKHPALYVVGYAHLDTEWRWEYPQVISEYIPKTMHDNFALFEKYPHYIFNFSGANRYRMMKEYFPADFAKVKQYVASGRWFPAGSSMEEGDVNSPSAESILRQFLYGNEFFRHEFGKTSAEYMLPDCFGFPESLPSLLAHAGIKGFSTQKLTWGSAAAAGGPGSPEDTPAGIPFNVGLWEGPDGRSVIAALNPGSYNGNITTDLSKSNAPPAGSPPGNTVWDWPKRVQLNGEVSGLYTDYRYYGVGDTGGAPREPSVKLLEAIVNKGSAVLPPPRNPNESFGDYQQRVAATTSPAVTVGGGPLAIVSATAEQMFLDIKPEQTARLPRYKGDLELTNHSAGSLSSETYHKRWNHKNELLADAAERASVMAAWLGAMPYAQERLNRAWTLVMGGQFHDIMAGTATPKSYEFSWNDDVLAMNQFASVLTSASEAVVSGLDTRTKGTPLVIYNPLNLEREDVVEASLSFPNGAPKGIRVLGPDGKEVPAQIAAEASGTAKILFLGKAPSAGYAVYDVQSSGQPSGRSSVLRATDSSLENGRYRILLDKNGDISSIFDKSINKELLSSPIRFAFQTEKPHDWPAWNMDWEDQRKPPRAYVQGPAKVRIAENGPVRVALEITREAEGSVFVQTIRLSAGDAGDRVEIENAIDWKTSESALKVVFPLTAENPEATYNWDVGTIRRANNDERKFEVPSHQWLDLTDKSGAYGATVLSDCKYGSDKPDDRTLRLTILYTPGLGGGNGNSYSDQTTQDWGHHKFVFGLAGHAGDWRREQTDWQAYRLSQPLVAFQSLKHAGSLGKSISLVNLNNKRVRVLALKKAEESDEIILRVVEMSGEPQQNVRVRFAAPVEAAREVTGQEQPLGGATIARGELATDLSPYQLRTFALKLAPAPVKMAAPRFQPVALPYDRAVASTDGMPSTDGFDDAGNSLPAEMLPGEILYSGIQFRLAPAAGGKPDAVVARGQTVSLPQGDFNRLYVLAASAEGDQRATFQIGSESAARTIQDWSGYIGQWDNRKWTTKEEPVEPRPGSPAGTPQRTRKVMEYAGLAPGYIKRAPVAWFASHRHNASGANEPYSYSYLFAYAIDVPAKAKTLTLPDNEKIRILGITAAKDAGELRPAEPLYDVIGPH